MIRFATSLALLCACLFAQAQDFLGDYKWKSTPALHELSEDEKEYSELILLEKHVKEFEYNAEGQLKEYNLFHTIVKVGSDQAIQKNNKVYLPLYNVQNIIQNKARVVTSSGKVIELEEDDVQEAVDQRNQMSFKYYAIEGIDKGSEVEYFYITEVNPYVMGRSVRLQSETEKRNVSFEIVSPDFMEFATKSFNELPQMIKDTSLKDRTRLYVTAKTIPGLREETYTTYKSNLQQVHYKLDKNTKFGDEAFIDYSVIAQNIYGQFYTSPDKSVMKKVKKIIKAEELDKPSSLKEKIRGVEDYIKMNFQIAEAQVAGLDDLEKVLQTGAASERSILRLFLTFYDLLEVETQLVMTSNRYKDKFDPKFESVHYLSEFLIYLPQIDDHIAPGAALSRLGFIPHQWFNNYGLYISALEFAGSLRVMSNIKFIEPVPFDKTGELTEVDITFEDNLMKPKINLKRSLSGYYAQGYQQFYDYYTDERLKEMNESLIKFFNPNIEVGHVKIENAGSENFGIHPIVASALVETDVFTEKAGNKFLFKIGEVIGPQTEMYQKEQRKQDVECSYNRLYQRKLKFNIPEGYQVKNLDDLEFNIFHEEEGEKTMAFISSFSQNEAEVIVEIDEYYKNIIYPKEQFEEFRKVINAAADFNKVVLILEKE